jgi:hypothetical protein
MHRRPPRLLGTALMACVPVLGLLLACGPTAGASTTGASPSARVAAARALLEHLGIGQRGTDQRVAGHVSKVNGLSQVESTNWSGYADTGSGFTTVTAKWTEPRGTCTSANPLAAFWVGIDGYNSSTVEQDGTVIECDGGVPSYFTWWEMYPKYPIEVVGDTLEPGDVITASVVRSGTSYKLSVTDSTHPANSFTTTRSCSDCANNSAEVIAEAPCCTSSGGILPLAHFGVFTPYAATVKTASKSGVISSFTDYEMTMVDEAGNVEAQPGPLNAPGRQFKVTWRRST